VTKKEDSAVGQTNRKISEACSGGYTRDLVSRQSEKDRLVKSRTTEARTGCGLFPTPILPCATSLGPAVFLSSLRRSQSFRTGWGLVSSS
jgi:hypothetical protein